MYGKTLFLTKKGFSMPFPKKTSLCVKQNFTIKDNFTCSLEQTSPYHFDVKSIGEANS